MDGWSARAVPGVRRGRVSSQFVSREVLFSSPSRTPSLPLAHHGAPWRLFVNFLVIERLGEGGARQSTRWMNLRRMQIRASPLRDRFKGTKKKKKKSCARDNSTTDRHRASCSLVAASACEHLPAGRRNGVYVIGEDRRVASRVEIIQERVFKVLNSLTARRRKQRERKRKRLGRGTNLNKSFKRLTRFIKLRVMCDALQNHKVGI